MTELVEDTESPLLSHHSSRVHYRGALTGKRRSLGRRSTPAASAAGVLYGNLRGFTAVRSCSRVIFA